MRIKSFLKANKWRIVVLFVVLLVQCVFISQKEGYHMDEILSFQLGNAEYNPWIVPTQPEGRLAKFIHNEIDGETFGETVGNVVATVKDVLENKGESKLLSYTADVYEEPVWIGRETFTDYVMVDAADDFNYLSVYFNVKDDNHQIEGHVYSGMPAGSETLVSVKVGNSMLTVKELGSTHYATDETVYLGFNPDKINVFENESQMLIKYCV